MNNEIVKLPNGDFQVTKNAFEAKKLKLKLMIQRLDRKLSKYKYYDPIIQTKYPHEI
jgi:hypothetical protein